MNHAFCCLLYIIFSLVHKNRKTLSRSKLMASAGQRDFTSLVVHGSHLAKDAMLLDVEILCCDDKLTDSGKDTRKTGDNANQDEEFLENSTTSVYAMELVTDSSESAVLQVSSPESMPSFYEPMRPCSTQVPPKRFYRTFWRSISRRMVAEQ